MCLSIGVYHLRLDNRGTKKSPQQSILHLIGWSMSVQTRCTDPSNTRAASFTFHSRSPTVTKEREKMGRNSARNYNLPSRHTCEQAEMRTPADGGGQFTHNECVFRAAEDALPATNPAPRYPQIPSVDEVVNFQYFLQHKWALLPLKDGSWTLARRE